MAGKETQVARRDEAQRSAAPWPTRIFDDFHEEMDGLLDNFFGTRFPALRRGWAALPQGAMSPAIDVSENGKQITLTAELPGLSEEDVELEVKDGRLTLKGEKRHEEERKEDNFHLMERSYGAFQRSMPVPDTVDESKISASFDKGVLKVTMPKKPEAKKPAGRKISIGK